MIHREINWYEGETEETSMTIQVLYLRVCVKDINHDDRNRYYYNAVPQQNVSHKHLGNGLENIPQNFQPYMERTITPQIIVGIPRFQFKPVCTFQD